MAYAPPPESESARHTREDREAQAKALGCSVDEVYLQGRLEALRSELSRLDPAARRARVEEARASHRGFLDLCAEGQVAHTLGERARHETGYAYAQWILDGRLERFLEATPVFYRELRAACPYAGGSPEAPPPGV